ncbi:MAG: DUF433 domain-containing protein [Chitinophagales bacterium]|nr:DUF433 domain-containing protein [Chitinophagales bacterium]
MNDKLLKLIEVNPKVMFGKPVVKGTRIPVDLILERLSYGSSEKEIMESYPNITKKAIQACLWYAALQIRNENIYSIAS